MSGLLPGSGPDPGFGYPDPDDPNLRVKIQVGSRLSVTIPDPLFSLSGHWPAESPPEVVYVMLLRLAILVVLGNGMHWGLGLGDGCLDGSLLQ